MTGDLELADELNRESIATTAAIAGERLLGAEALLALSALTSYVGIAEFPI